MANVRRYKFVINAYAPETIPMVRLAEYMRDLGHLLGEEKYVHFDRLEAGSTAIVNTIEEEVVPNVHSRVRAVAQDNGPSDAIRAYNAINQKLFQDKANGFWCEIGEEKPIIDFPGNDYAESVTFGPFNEAGSLDGIIIKIGGKSDWVPVHIQQGQHTFVGHARRDLAQQMGSYLFTEPVRVFGTGRWYRDTFGQWNLRKFTISHFEVLKKQSLRNAFETMRMIGIGGWDESDDPVGDLMYLRHGEK